MNKPYVELTVSLPVRQRNSRCKELPPRQRFEEFRMRFTQGHESSDESFREASLESRPHALCTVLARIAKGCIYPMPFYLFALANTIERSEPFPWPGRVGMHHYGFWGATATLRECVALLPTTEAVPPASLGPCPFAIHITPENPRLLVFDPDAPTPAVGAAVTFSASPLASGYDVNVGFEALDYSDGASGGRPAYFEQIDWRALFRGPPAGAPTPRRVSRRSDARRRTGKRV